MTQTFTINQPLPLTYTMTHTDEFCINADGTATVNVSGVTVHTPIAGTPRRHKQIQLL